MLDVPVVFSNSLKFFKPLSQEYYNNKRHKIIRQG
jgi:hypothetical protein